MASNQWEETCSSRKKKKRVWVHFLTRVLVFRLLAHRLYTVMMSGKFNLES